MNTRLYTRLFF